MTWQSYELDRIAQKLVLDAQKRDADSLNQGHKMRMAVTYGLERFWGEHLRLSGKEQTKSDYWKATWDALVNVLEPTGLVLPNEQINSRDTNQIQTMSSNLWKIKLEDQRLAIAVLTQLCDCIVWWTQRYK